MLIVLFIYTMLGLELFSNRAKFDSSNMVDMVKGVSPMFNFDNFLNSMLTVYIVLTNDG
jgi:Ion transport protein